MFNDRKHMGAGSYSHRYPRPPKRRIGWSDIVAWLIIAVLVAIVVIEIVY